MASVDAGSIISAGTAVMVGGVGLVVSLVAKRQKQAKEALEEVRDEARDSIQGIRAYIGEVDDKVDDVREHAARIDGWLAGWQASGALLSYPPQAPRRPSTASRRQPGA